MATAANSPRQQNSKNRKSSTNGRHDDRLSWRQQALAETPIGWCTQVMKEASPAEKLLAALELQELGLQVKKTQIKRNNPDASPEEVDQLFLTWLQNRKPVPEGFRVISWPRK